MAESRPVAAAICGFREKTDGANIDWIMLGVFVALSVLVVGMIVYRKRAKRNERYFY